MKWFNPQFIQNSDSIHNKINKLFLDADKSVETRMYHDVNLLRIPYWVNAMDKSMMDLPVEVRMPFLDYRLVEYLFSLPTEYLYNYGFTKYVLRKSMNPDLPKSITWKKNKVGFTVPKNSWFNAHKISITESILDNSDFLSKYLNINNIECDISAMPNNLLWRVYNLSLWSKRFSNYI